MDSLSSLFQANPLETLLTLAALLLVTAMIVLPIIGGILYGSFTLLTLPMRRSERARRLLEILELGLAQGHTPERAIVAAARSCDPSLGGPFQRVARKLEGGMKLSAALAFEPRAVPRAVVGMLRAGESLGNVRAVLPACQRLLGDGMSQVTGALNYVVVLCFCVTPFMMSVPVMFRARVMPSFIAVFSELGSNAPLPYFSRVVFGLTGEFALIASLMLLFVWLLLLCYVGGPHLRGVFCSFAPGVTDALIFKLPWRRRRLQRDFSGLLALLLDGGVPETEAVRLAAEATDHQVIIKRAARVRARLAEGVPLPEALVAVDDAGELQWRLKNARPAAGGFSRALAGWLESLDAKAFQQEQTAAQLVTTSLILLNGAMVGAFVFAVYLALLGLIEHATLW